MKRILVLAAGVVLLFTVTVSVLLNVMPAPHRPTDYLVMGAVATLLCLLLLFLGLVRTVPKHPSGSFKDHKPDSEP